MKITYATNNKNGLNVLKELKKQNIEIEYLIIHPEEKGKYVEEIIKESNTKKENIITWNKENTEEIFKKLKYKKSEILLSVNFGYKIPKEILEIYKKPINLHLSYLPYNKGSNPNVWPIIENTPAGVTIHEMTEKIDGGRILYQEKVEKDITDNGKTLYEKLEKKSVEIIKNEFRNIIEGKYTPKANTGGTVHYTKDFKKICEIDMEKEYKAKDLINRLRALTYPPYKNAYFIDENGEKIYIEIKLSRDGEK